MQHYCNYSIITHKDINNWHKIFAYTILNQTKTSLLEQTEQDVVHWIDWKVWGKFASTFSKFPTCINKKAILTLNEWFNDLVSGVIFFSAEQCRAKQLAEALSGKRTTYCGSSDTLCVRLNLQKAESVEREHNHKWIQDHSTEKHVTCVNIKIPQSWNIWLWQCCDHSWEWVSYDGLNTEYLPAMVA